MRQITGSTPLTFDMRFPGQIFQLETGLVYNWHRHYDPTTGRYTRPDPLGFVDGPSVYGYATQSPMMKVDPTGLQAMSTSMPGSRKGEFQMCAVNGLSCAGATQRCVGAGIARDRCLDAGKNCMRTGLTTIFGPGIVGRARKNEFFDLGSP